MITEFDGWKEALLELKALKNLTDFLNNPAKALQIKAMDLLEEFSTEKQVAMMQDGLVQALLQTVVINEDEGVQSRALDYLFNISSKYPILSQFVEC
jgi:DNA transposition AAA+ family ATPase